MKRYAARLCAIVSLNVAFFGGRPIPAGEPTHDPAPNLIVEVSHRLASAVAQTPLDRNDPVRDNILKTDIYGCGRTTGRVSVAFLPCDRAALFELVMDARIDSNTVGFNGPVKLFNTSTSLVRASKRVCFDADGLRSDPAQSSNRTDSELLGLTTRFRRPVPDRVVSRAAHRRYDKDKEKARQIGEQHVDQRVAEGFDKDVDQELIKANRLYREKLRAPLEKRGLVPERLTTRTTASMLHVSARLVDAQSGEIPAPPAAGDGADATLWLHESMLNAGAERLLGGKTFSEKKLREELGELLGGVENLPPADDKDVEITLVFPMNRPVVYSFDRNMARVEIRGAKLLEKRVDAAEANDRGRVVISVAYQLEATANGFRAVRQGDVNVQFPDITGNSTRVSLRTLVRRHLADAFKVRFELDELKLPEDLKKVGKLVPSKVETIRGWLAIGVKRAG